MIHLFMDTNVYINLITQNESNGEMNCFNDMVKLLEHGVIQLLIPEIVILELEKFSTTVEEDFKEEIGKLKKLIKKEEVWSEIRDIKQNIYDLIEEKGEGKRESWKIKYENIMGKLKRNQNKHIEFTPEIMLNSQKRIIAGKFKNSSKSTIKKSDQDIYIIESLICYDNGLDNDDLILFCSENTKDFADKKNNGDLVMHHYFQENFKTIINYFKYLEEVMDYINVGFETAVIKDKININSSILLEDAYQVDDSEEYYNKFKIENKKYIEELIRVFKEKIEPTIPKYILDIRKQKTEENRFLLQECRRSKSWDDNSELQLYNWLEEVDEGLIGITTLVKILDINDNLKEYLEIHKEK